MAPDSRQRRTHALQIFRAALQAADPGRAVRRALAVEGGQLSILGQPYPLKDHARLVVLGAGKATPAMAAAAEEILGERLSGGAINTKYGHTLPLSRITTTECGHPLPDQAGVEGTERMLGLLEGLGSDDLVLCLFSGGGSALMPAPATGLTLADKQATTQALLACGAPIEEINAFRKHLSKVKGGQLVRQANPARVVSLLISDVIGDRLDTIASGPTHPDTTTFAQCLALVERYQLTAQLPAPVLRHLGAGAAGALPETPKAGDPCFARTRTEVVGSNVLAIEAAEEAARALGYQTLVLSSRIAGETREVAAMHAAIAQEVCATGRPQAPPACIISGGETTVTLRGKGKGGRNQEFALAAALQLDGWERVTCLSGGTDGTDGPTDAAGALADGSTVQRARQLGLSAAASLRENDAYPFFAALDDLLITGPTGTNVMDLRLLLIS
ncbi:MAG: glycerate kinase [Candidatus Latescibacteria bacterium]|nr:glycerate kinase [Candidatus Latescibacterota bacterium]